MYIHICIHIYIYVYICIHTCIHTHILSIYTYIYIYVYIHVYIHIYKYINMHVHKFIHSHIYIHAYTYIFICAGCMSYLTTEEAMADAASFLTAMHAGLLLTVGSVGPVVGFGGSYGGMLATWFRLQVSHGARAHACSFSFLLDLSRVRVASLSRARSLSPPSPSPLLSPSSSLPVPLSPSRPLCVPPSPSLSLSPSLSPPSPLPLSRVLSLAHVRALSPVLSSYTYTYQIIIPPHTHLWYLRLVESETAQHTDTHKACHPCVCRTYARGTSHKKDSYDTYE